MEKKKRTSIIRFTYIGLTILIIVLIGIFDPSIKEMVVALELLNLRWLYVCLLCLLLYWLTDGLLLHDITSYMYKRQPLWRSAKIGIIGLYYGALTPFATGGQPMQIVYMRRTEMPTGTATCIVSVKFVVYELSLCAFYIIAMLFRGSYFFTNFNTVFWLTTLGFAINALAVVFIIMIIINRRLVEKLATGLVNLLARFRIVKKKDKVLKNLNKSIGDYRIAASSIAHNKLRAVGSFIISIINLAFFFAIPYFIYLAFGEKGLSLLDLIILQAFLYLAVSFFPMPGAAGAAETGFYLFFSAIFINVPVFIAMLVWRFLTYYLMLIVGSVLVVFDEVIAHWIAKKKAAKK